MALQPERTPARQVQSLELGETHSEDSTGVTNIGDSDTGQPVTVQFDAGGESVSVGSVSAVVAVAGGAVAADDLPGIVYAGAPVEHHCGWSDHNERVAPQARAGNGFRGRWQPEPFAAGQLPAFRHRGSHPKGCTPAVLTHAVRAVAGTAGRADGAFTFGARLPATAAAT